MTYTQLELSVGLGMQFALMWLVAFAITWTFADLVGIIDEAERYDDRQ